MQEIDAVIEQHGGWPAAFQTSEAKATDAKVIAFRPRRVEPTSGARYKTCVPLVPLKAAAGAFGDPQHVEADGFEWVAVTSGHRLRPGMFVAQRSIAVPFHFVGPSGVSGQGLGGHSQHGLDHRGRVMQLGMARQRGPSCRAIGCFLGSGGEHRDVLVALRAGSGIRNP